MSNIVNQTRLDYYTRKLWEKIKAQFPDEALVSATLLPDGITLQFTTNKGQEINIDLSNFARLDAENVFTKPNWFEDVILDKFFDVSSESYGTGRGDVSNRYLGDRQQSSDLFDGYVSCVRVYVVNSTTATDVTGVKVYAVEKGGSLAADRVQERLVNNESFPIQIDADTNTKYIEIPIHRYFENPTYFLIYDTTNPKALETVNNIAPEHFGNIANSTVEPSFPNGTITDSNARYTLHMVTYGGLNVKNLIDELSGESIVAGSTVDKGLILEKKSGETIEIDLSPALKAENVSYDNANTGLNFQNVQEVLDYLEEDKASLNKDNVFIGHNTFNEVILMGKTSFVETSAPLQGGDGHSPNVYCGMRSVSTHYNIVGNTRYISAIKIRVADKFAIGDMVDSIYVTEITKNTSRVDDIVGETVVSNGSFIVEEDAEYNKCIYVPVGKEYANDTYFLIGKKGTKGLRECRYPYQGEINECVNNIGIDNLPQQGSPLNHNHGNGWIIMHSLVTDDINVRDELSQLNDKVNNLQNETVTSVNNETPVGGNVTINAEHIPYDNATSLLISTDVQKAIDELKRDMTLLDTSDIHIVSDNAELTTLLGQGTLNKGDLVYIINSNGVVDFNGNNVSNGGNPVAMIYDSDITTPGNKLRVFSKFDTPINISADIVAYNDQTTQLGATDVQGAIEKLKEKMDAGVTSVKYDNNKTLSVTTGGTRQDYDLSPLIGIKSINGEEGADGDINLSINETNDTLEFQVGGVIYHTLNYMTDQQADTIINGWN